MSTYDFGQLLGAYVAKAMDQWQHIGDRVSYSFTSGDTIKVSHGYSTAEDWWHCVFCGALIPNGQTHACPALDPLSPAGNQIGQYPEPILLHEYTDHPPATEPDLCRGWICPRCRKVWGPLIPNCDCEPENT